ncbi:hypothetical protein GIB67_023269 [Kingdonia uniflora]|uniref:Uncharacterized protein n=1 Tax=Kingdonia uniflora TaxID=39325 RepID=A0A7J7MT43_9MAGN|nr:hypothetical protein GIB67_023269 [Kingdonia uniflora]
MSDDEPLDLSGLKYKNGDDEDPTVNKTSNPFPGTLYASKHVITKDHEIAENPEIVGNAYLLLKEQIEISTDPFPLEIIHGTIIVLELGFDVWFVLGRLGMCRKYLGFASGIGLIIGVDANDYCGQITAIFTLRATDCGVERSTTCKPVIPIGSLLPRHHRTKREEILGGDEDKIFNAGGPEVKSVMFAAVGSEVKKLSQDQVPRYAHDLSV